MLEFHISNLEYACGCDLRTVSAINWDQNEAFPQFGGDHIMLSGGYSAVMDSLAVNLKVHLNTKVSYQGQIF